MSFAELGLSPELLRALDDAGYVSPTPIQEQAIPFVLRGRDVLGCAQTGTGKTASFTLPMIDILAAGRSRARMPRSLILEPTRELAAQVEQNFEMHGAQHKLTTALIIGGESMSEQEKKLNRGVDVLIATPGRLLDQFERGNILMTDIRMLIIDECDRMLDMGFIPDIERIVARLPRQRQTLMFSATLPPEIRRLADKFLNDPKEITVAPPASTAATVEQALVTVAPADKRKVLRALIGREDVRNALIFCNRKRDVAILYKSLAKHGFSVGQLHGDMAQSSRTETLAGFKADQITLLVCSDVAARGIDIKGLSHVFNFDVPIHAEDYVHRIGRTGRAGLSGRAFTLATPDDAKFITAIEALIGKPIPRVSIEGFEEPTADDAAVSESRPRRPRGGRGEAPARTRDGASRPREAPARAREAPVRPSEPPVRAPGEAPAWRTPEPSAHRDRARGDDRDRRRNRFRSDDEPDTPVVGFGDHTPAFLLPPSARKRA